MTVIFCLVKCISTEASELGLVLGLVCLLVRVRGVMVLEEGDC